MSTFRLDGVAIGGAGTEYPVDTVDDLKTSHSPDAKYYTTKELAVVVGYSERWVVKWRRKIRGAFRIGRFWRFDRAIVDRLIAQGKGPQIIKT